MMPVFTSPTAEDITGFLQKTADRRLAFINHAGNFLRHAFPDIVIYYNRGTDWVTPLAASAIDVFVTPIHEQIADLSKTAANPQGWAPQKPTPETLVKLIDQRDKITAQITNLKTAMEKLGESLPGISEMLNATAMPMLDVQLESIEAQISNVQRQLEEKPQE